MCGLQGVFLSKVNEVGPSYKAGLRPGDKLLMVQISVCNINFFVQFNNARLMLLHHSL